MLNLLLRLRLRWRVRAYFAKAPRFLFDDYGHGGPFTPRQVAACLDRHKVGGSPLEHAYAVAIFSSPELLADPGLQAAFKLKRSLADLRGDVARWHDDFDPSAATGYSAMTSGLFAAGAAPGGHGGHCGGGHDAGHGHGGHCGGGHH